MTTSDNELEPVAPSLPPVTQSNRLIELLKAAVDRGADVATLERLAKLYESAEANEQRKAYNQALAAAKAELPTIIKDKQVQRQSGGELYKYETFAAIAEAVDPVLAKHGLFYRFPDGDEVSPDPAKITVTCRLSHRDGYYEDTSRSALPDVGQNRNAVQAMGSTITYLQRYTLKAALGLAVSQDKDGAAKQRFAGRPESFAQPAEQAAPQHDYHPAKPELIVRSTEQWQDWTATLLRMIKAAPSKNKGAVVEQWVEKNQEHLGQLLIDIPGHHQFVMREINKRLRPLRDNDAA